MSTSPTPETDAAAWRDEGTNIRVVEARHAERLERERNQIQHWKEEMLTVWKKWDEVDAAVRKHPDTVVGHNVSDTVLRFIQERDELSWVPVAERMPTEEDANEYGDVDWSDGKDVWEAHHTEPREATHWRRIVLP